MPAEPPSSTRRAANGRHHAAWRGRRAAAQAGARQQAPAAGPAEVALLAALKREMARGRRAQAELARLQQALDAEQGFLRRDLIANVSHDLRTPLVSMRGYLELLASKDGALSAEQRRDYLAVALRQSDRLATLIDELFELAKLDFNGLQLNREAFAMGELAVDVLQKFRLAAEERRLRLRVDMAPQLPQVHADLGLIERVLENLIGNALKYTPAGGEVCVRGQVLERHLRVQVLDTGCGIAPDELPQVFERFYRGSGSAARSSCGAGLGLAIAKRIVALHQGRITAESEPGRGSCFSFELPLDGAG